MPKLATWIREKDQKWFQPFLDFEPEIQVLNALAAPVDVTQADGLLLTGGADVAPEFLRQEVPNGIELDTDIDLERDRWEFAAVSEAMSRGLPIFAICKGMQVLNVALGGTLKLDIPGHRAPEMKEQDIQPLVHVVDVERCNLHLTEVGRWPHSRFINTESIRKPKDVGDTVK